DPDRRGRGRATAACRSPTPWGSSCSAYVIAPPFLGFSAPLVSTGPRAVKGHAAGPRGVDCRTCEFIFAPGGGAVRPRRSRVSTNPWDAGGPQEGPAREAVIEVASRGPARRDRVI